MSADYFILSLMRLYRDHYQRVDAVRMVTGNDMEYYLLVRNGELKDLVLGHLDQWANSTLFDSVDNMVDYQLRCLLQLKRREKRVKALSDSDEVNRAAEELGQPRFGRRSRAGIS